MLASTFVGCGSSKERGTGDLDGELLVKNRPQLSLLAQIRRKRGVTIAGGVPVILSESNNVTQAGRLGTQQPLYVINDLIVGNSFRDVEQVVEPFSVAEITILKGPDASIYGSRGSSGVILIKTKQ